jgi:hypothetical protein
MTDDKAQMWSERSLYYDMDGHPMEMAEWRRVFGDIDRRRIARTELPNATISTVWLGIDHGWGEGPPLIFETMWFKGADGEEMERYATKAEALAGHERMVAKAKAATNAKATAEEFRR